MQEFFAALYVDFLDFEKLLLPGGNSDLRLYRSPNSSAFDLKGIDEEAKGLDGKVIYLIEKAHFFVGKVVVTDSVNFCFEKSGHSSLHWKSKPKFHYWSWS